MCCFRWIITTWETNLASLLQSHIVKAALNTLYVLILVTAVWASVAGRHALERSRKSTEAHADYTTGIQCCNRMDFENALAFFSKAIAEQPGYISAYVDRSRIYSEFWGRKDKALSDLTTAITINPRCYEAFIKRGEIYLSQGLYKKAISDFSTAVRLCPRSSTGYCQRGAAYHHLGEYPKALADYSIALQFNPGNVKALIARKRLLVVIKQIEELK